MKLMPLTTNLYHQLINEGYTHLVRRYENPDHVITFEAIKSEPEKMNAEVCLHSEHIKSLLNNKASKYYVLIKTGKEQNKSASQTQSQSI